MRSTTQTHYSSEKININKLAYPDADPHTSLHLDSTHHGGHNSTRSSADVQLVTEQMF